MINVTQTFLPPLDEYKSILERAWSTKWITNRGELVKELEEELKHHLGVSNIILTCNGTVPLQIAIKALELKGEVITTPFSYVATTSSIVWENCTPVFVDIDPEHLTIDESKIEAAITGKTTGILATHVFGNPCNIEAIENIAKKNNLKVIYDAAHCFGVNYNSKSVFSYGDVSTCSFHATKIFHTGEGGAMFAGDDSLHNKLFYHHNFGHKGPEAFQGLGINGKMSELCAALGLSILPYLDDIYISRMKMVEYYLDQLQGSGLQFLKIRANTDWNYSYFPVLFPSAKALLKTKEALNNEQIMPRRYFYPVLSSIDYTGNQATPVATDVSERILCLPIFHELGFADIDRIVKIVKENLK